MYVSSEIMVNLEMFILQGFYVPCNTGKTQVQRPPWNGCMGWYDIQCSNVYTIATWSADSPPHDKSNHDGRSSTNNRADLKDNYRRNEKCSIVEQSIEGSLVEILSVSFYLQYRRNVYWTTTKDLRWRLLTLTPPLSMIVLQSPKDPRWFGAAHLPQWCCPKQTETVPRRWRQQAKSMRILLSIVVNWYRWARQPFLYPSSLHWYLMKLS